jgi:hypothetical protein
MNTRFRNTLLLTLLILAAFLVTVSAFAQDTPAPQSTQEAVAIVTQEATATQETGDTGNTTTDTTSPWSQVPWGIIGLFVTGAAGMWKLPDIIRAIKEDKKAIAEAEARGNALPEAFRNGVNRMADVAESFAGVVKEATDGIAAASKPTAVLDLSTVSTEALQAELRKRPALAQAPLNFNPDTVGR